MASASRSANARREASEGSQVVGWAASPSRSGTAPCARWSARAAAALGLAAALLSLVGCQNEPKQQQPPPQQRMNDPNPDHFVIGSGVPVSISLSPIWTTPASAPLIARKPAPPQLKTTLVIHLDGPSTVEKTYQVDFTPPSGAAWPAPAPLLVAIPAGAVQSAAQEVDFGTPPTPITSAYSVLVTVRPAPSNAGEITPVLCSAVMDVNPLLP